MYLVREWIRRRGSQWFGAASVGLFSAAICLYYWSARAESQRASTLLSVPPAVQLGVVDEGQVIPFSFTLTNSSPYPIEIISITPTCGCTLISDAHGAAIEPGKQLEIAATLDTENRHDEYTTHAVLSYRFANDAQRKDVPLAARTIIRPRFQVSPEPVRFLMRPTDKVMLSRDVDIDSIKVASFKVTEVEVSSSVIAAEILDPQCRTVRGARTPARLRIQLDTSKLARDPKTRAPALSVRLRIVASETYWVNIPIELESPEGGAL